MRQMTNIMISKDGCDAVNPMLMKYKLS